MSNPLIQAVPTLTPDQLQLVNSYCETGGIERNESTVFSGSVYRGDKKIRSSTGFTLLEGTPITEIIGGAINAALVEYKNRLEKIHPSYTAYTLAPAALGTSSHREGIQVLEYRPGQKYNFHYDQNWDRNNETFYRTISVVLYLTSDFEGGGTEFADAVYKPQPGEALIFPSSWCFPHSGQEVTSGMKRVAVTWYYVYPTPQN
jgi:hypothetical protein